MSKKKINSPIRGILLAVVIISMGACNSYLDVVPDNVATIDNAFALRTQAKKYLYTCYSYLPKNGNMGDDPTIAGGDEVWSIDSRGAYFNIAKGFQKVVGPYGDRWDQYYRAIRDCNIFLENIDRVPDMQEFERRQWISEVKFLKAYYHFYLVRMYGAIPIVHENLPVDADGEEVRVSRDPFDVCINYIVELIDESMENLPVEITDPMQELGRITQPIALSVKAYALVMAASPLFNGNPDYTSLANPDGTLLFPSEFSQEKWVRAAEACKAAIDLAHSQGYELYYYKPVFQQYDLTDTIIMQMNVRNSVTERWNSEIIWGNTMAPSDGLQALMATWLDPGNLDITATRGELSPPLKVAEMYYSDNGVPINEDKTFSYEGRYGLRVSEDDDRLYVKKGYTTALVNYGREPRFYAHLGFDGSIWYGQGRYDDKDFNNLFYIEAKFRQRNGIGKDGYSTVTGYYVKKMIHYENVTAPSGNTYSITSYPWPLVRLTDLYLLYAEALNEAQGPSSEVYEYLDLIRERAGLKGIVESWTNFSTNPSKFNSKEGLRDIIQRERLIELAFEGHRFWDLRRWKKATEYMNQPITGWDLGQEIAANYYRPVVIFNQNFGVKDYLWPIAESNIIVNRNLVQNIGW
ncbi:RagB/SusD family nutrient uptake outer membrane protein [Parapedobacter pyrenivorans]|uniref:RagB/SusD family nutrient uptake outer membrane protein n=1 Tax=Parapedobacter pyrenivorans TaxID=1305674 RepID=UPI0033405A80